MNCPDPGTEDLQQPVSLPPSLSSPPQHGVPAFTVLQPDGPLAVLQDRAQKISVSLAALGRGWQLAGETRHPLGSHFCPFAQ